MHRLEILIVAALLCAVPQNCAAADQPRAVHVDASKITGSIRSLQGVNLGPAHSRDGLPDLTRQFRDLRIDFVRTHDFYGPTDIDFAPPGQSAGVIFPDWNADPELESSYHFAASDPLVLAIVASGAQVYYRLGRSWNAPATPPPDFDKFASVARHIAMHYNGGWANGHRLKIRYWEFWNEPDTTFKPDFWTGSPDQLFLLYEKTARALKSYDPTLKVGALGFALPDVPNRYRDGLLRYCVDHKVPLDFFSWHQYGTFTGDPYQLVRVARTVRSLLDSYGLTSTESHLNEWNLDLAESGVRFTQGSATAAAYTATALVYLQDAPVDYSFYYRGDAGHKFSIFSASGEPLKKAFAFKSTAMLMDTPVRVAATGGDEEGFSVLAGRSKDGRTVQVMITNYEIHAPLPPVKERATRPAPAGYHLTVEQLPWSAGNFTWKRYRVSEKMNFEVVGQGTSQGSAFQTTSDLANPGFELLILEKTQ